MESASKAHLPPSPTDIADHSPSESNTELPESSSRTRMEDDGREEDVQKNEELLKKYTPCLEMDFESQEAAFEFYNEYGRITGFSVRKAYTTKNRIDDIVISQRFVCNKEGQRGKDKRYLVVENPKKETRTNCLALMHISLNRETSKWVVTKFEEKHNHPLHLPQCAHMMKSQRSISQAQAINIDIAADTGLSLKASHDLFSAQMGGKESLGYTREDQKNYLRTRRQRSLEYGESGALLEYFQKEAAQNPYFYYAIQLDVEQMITNIFWADHEMITDYGLFGDAVSFDTTFQTNKEYRPFALFSGFNHFRMTSIFGAALLYDETSESFEWLFKTFLHAMSGKKPTTIFTDQDAAMAKAISIVMLDVSHGLCTFHLNQNALKHLGHLFHTGSKFGEELNACIYGYEDEDELHEAWDTLIKKYNLQDNTWMKKTWEIKEKWAHVYMKWSFTTGMWSTQVSESLNARLKKCLKSDLNIVQFFIQFGVIVVEKRYEEARAIYHSREKLQRLKLKKCPILIQVAELYTPPLFDLFHDEVDTSLGCKVKQCLELEGEFTYVIAFHTKDVEYVVNGSIEIDESGNTICRNVYCSCRKFESFGILCSHAIKALDRMSVMEIPESYILGRWRLNVKDCELEKDKSRVEENDPKLLKAARFRIICLKMVKLATRLCELQEAYEYVEENIMVMCAKVASMFLGEGAGGSVEVETKELETVDPQFAQVKGLKKKNGLQIKGRRRLKPWFEKKFKKRKQVVSQSRKKKQVVSQSRKRKEVVSQSICLSEHIDHVAATTIVNGSFFKQPPEVESQYVPQMMSYEDSWQSIPSSFQVSYDPHTFKEMPFDLTSHSSKKTNSFLDEASFLQILNYPGYPKQN